LNPQSNEVGEELEGMVKTEEAAGRNKTTLV